MRIRVVEDQACPRCGGEGSPKVWDTDGTCWWKCLSRECTIGYWVPEDGRIEERPPADEAAAMAARIKAEIDEQMKGRVWVCRSIRSGVSESHTIPEGDPIPDGYHKVGSPECREHNG